MAVPKKARAPRASWDDSQAEVLKLRKLIFDLVEWSQLPPVEVSEHNLDWLCAGLRRRSDAVLATFDHDWRVHVLRERTRLTLSKRSELRKAPRIDDLQNRPHDRSPAPISLPAPAGLRSLAILRVDRFITWWHRKGA
jgi:hypothetical protein